MAVLPMDGDGRSAYPSSPLQTVLSKSRETVRERAKPQPRAASHPTTSEPSPSTPRGPQESLGRSWPVPGLLAPDRSIALAGQDLPGLGQEALLEHGPPVGVALQQRHGGVLGLLEGGVRRDGRDAGVGAEVEHDGPEVQRSYLLHASAYITKAADFNSLTDAIRQIARWFPELIELPRRS
jgi:hypothetical protein